MTKTGKLELTWVNKYYEKKLEPRILVEDVSKSNTSLDINSKNMLIHGDNLIALKALEENYAKRIKCIYIDPPYNTGNAFEHYDDGVEHSIWLNLMYQRLKMLERLLSEDGVILVQIDKNEMAYMKVIMDEIFGRNNFITTVAVRMSATSGFKIEHADKTIVKNVEFIHIYSRNLKIKPSYDKSEYDPHYSYIIKKIDNKLYKMYQIVNELEVSSELEKYGLPKSSKSLTKLYNLSSIFQKYVSEHRNFIGRTHTAPADALKNKNTLMDLLPDKYSVIEHITPSGEMYYIKKTENSLNQYIPISLKFKPVDTTDGIEEQLSNILGDWWDGFYLDMGNVENEGAVDFKASKKPERLIYRILNMFTDEGDLVLDSFLGSGTTAAVAHKMKRTWIGIELGEHAYTHCKLRLDNVIYGEQGGISKAIKWSGGGGYRFYELAPSLLIKHDKLPIYTISQNYSFEMICKAICKLEGFIYELLGEMHGRASETRFIHIASELITGEYIKHITKQLSENDSVVIYGTKIQTNLKLPDNIEVKRIPKDLLKKYDFESEVR